MMCRRLAKRITGRCICGVGLAGGNGRGCVPWRARGSARGFSCPAVDFWWCSGPWAAAGAMPAGTLGGLLSGSSSDQRWSHQPSLVSSSRRPMRAARAGVYNTLQSGASLWVARAAAGWRVRTDAKDCWRSCAVASLVWLVVAWPIGLRPRPQGKRGADPWPAGSSGTCRVGAVQGATGSDPSSKLTWCVERPADIRETRLEEGTGVRRANVGRRSSHSRCYAGGGMRHSRGKKHMPARLRAAACGEQKGGQGPDQPATRKVGKNMRRAPAQDDATTRGISVR